MEIKKIGVFLFKGILALLGLVVFYVICGLVLPLIPVSEQKTSDPKDYDIFILTNGVHTDLVLPIKNDVKDWTQTISFGNTVSKRNDFNYVAIGWGDKGFYLDTPTWADLKLSTALKAAFWMSSSAMHCTFYKELKEGEDCKKIKISRQQYERLVKFVEKKFDYDPKGHVKWINTKAVYGANDAFYDAIGSYSFLETCNTWANEGLKVAGQRAALWTPTDFGIFRHYKN